MDVDALFSFPCASQSLFGIDCPICGFQRALVLLMQLDIWGSLKAYPPLIPILVLMVVALLRLVKPSWVTARLLEIYSLVALVIVGLNFLVNILLALLG